MKKIYLIIVLVLVIIFACICYFVFFNQKTSSSSTIENNTANTSKLSDDDISQKVEKNSDNEKIEAGIEITASDVLKEPLKYYGRSVINYAEPNEAPMNYEIFHSDGENIYLIADNYIPSDFVPLSQKGNRVVAGMSLELAVAKQDYEDIDTLTDNPATKWISKYLESGYNCLPERLNEMRFLLDLESWSVLKSDKAQYAIAAPTVEMFVESYNVLHPNKKIDLKLNEKNYLFKWSTDSEDKYDNNLKGIDKREFNNIFVMHNPDERASSVLVSYEGENANSTTATFAIDFTGTLGWSLYNCMAGLRPVICLNSDVTLVSNDNGELSIK
jgi:hypothetical protein